MRLFSQTNKKILMILPAILFLLVFAGYGIVQALMESLTSTSTEGLTLENYQRLFDQQAFIDSFFFSLRVSFISTILSLIVGLMITKFIYEHLKNRSARLFVWLPMLFPHFIAGYMIILLISQTGWVSTIFMSLGFISDPSAFPILTMDRNGVGIILTYVWKEIPFVILMLLPVFHQIDTRYKEVVTTLGGGRWDVFFTVEWRWILPVFIETGLIIFAFVLAAFEIPYLLGATYPSMLPVLSYQWFFEGDWSNRPLALASMFVITSMILVLAFLFLSSIQNMRERMAKGG